MKKLADGMKWVMVRNGSGEIVPAFGLMAITGVETTGQFAVGKPSQDGQSGILINGPTAIPIDADGQGTYDAPWFAIYDPADGTPAAGESWGAGAGSWKLRRDRNGFSVFGSDGFERAIVARPTGGECGVVHKVITGVTSTRQEFKYICWSSGKVIFEGCENHPDLNCEQPPPPGGGGGSTCCSGLGNLTATLTNSSCVAIVDPTTFTMVKKGGGVAPPFNYWEGGHKYAEVQVPVFGGDVEHYCCTVEAFAMCNSVYSNAAGTDSYLFLRYWKVVNDSGDALTYEDLIALEEAGDANTQVCTIGTYSPLKKECFTATGQSRSQTGLTFTLYDTFADCETELGVAPCCKTNGMTIDLELES